MRWLLLTLMIGGLLCSGAYANTPSFDEGPGPASGGFPGVRSDIPELTNFFVGGPAMTDVWCTGLGYHQGIFWVSGSDFDGDETNADGDNGIYFYDEYGNYIGGFPQPTQDTWGWRDSGYNGTHLIYGASSPHAGMIFYVNATTMAVEYEFNGCPFGTCRALAVDYFDAGVMTYRVSDYASTLDSYLWTVGDPSALPIGSCPAASANPYGLAFDNGNNTLWMTESNAGGIGYLYAVDPISCVVMNTYDMSPESPRFGGAVMAQTSHGCNLWTMVQTEPNDALFGWATGGDNPFACSGATAVEPATWGSIKANYQD